MSPAGDGSRTLYALIALCIANHMVLVGARIAMTLSALAQGAGAGDVGLLLALFALLPMLGGVAAGRWSDRVGVRRPMQVGSVLLAVATTLPCAIGGLWPLYVAAPLIGIAFTVFQV
ncbi:MAG: MFS transporter, partial [Casimicrobiaceae bacterium]